MILTIKNLGALKEAEIDLSKDLILLCGHNNTGKTYVAYAIYEHLKIDFNTNSNKTNIHYFSSERAAINIFSKELVLNKNQFFDKILKTKGEDRTKLLEFAEQNINRYSKPIADELNIAEDLLHLQNGKSDFDFLAIELEKSILEGKISVGQYGGLRYQPNFYDEKQNRKENVILEIYQTSSLVKSLASLVFYLRHLANKNECIIIDEPELNLHPNNQILVARFLARLVNEGFKVVASTHSDYVIGELSNLLMLNNSFEDKEKLMERYNYNQNEILDKEHVGVYYFEKNKETAITVEITKRGIQIDSMDEAIADLNERSSAIFYTLLETDDEE
jgi:predicted ATPase